MPLIQSYHCDDLYSVAVPPVLTGENCFVTGYALATISPATTSPLYVQDAGNLQYALAWVVFFLVMIFLGMVWNAVPFLNHDR